MPSLDELERRVAALENGTIDLDQLPLADLETWLTNNRPLPNADQMMLPHSVRDSAIGMLPFCVVTRTADLSIANVTATAITWQSALYSEAQGDPYGMHHPATNPTRVTATRDGWYLAAVQVEWAASGAGTRRFAQIARNGVQDQTSWRGDVPPGVAGSPPTSNATGLFPLRAGEYLEVYVYQDSGGALSLIGSASDPGAAKFAVIWQHHNVFESDRGI